MNLSGRPKIVYDAFLNLLMFVHEKHITANQLLNETVRQLVLFRDEKRQRMASLIAELESARDGMPLSSEHIVTIVKQHLATKGASRLPVLVVSAVYDVVQSYLGERTLPLEAHNAADSQTNAIGDLQVTLEDDDNVVTCYEMKTKRVTTADIDLVIQEKITQTSHTVDNYIFITTDVIDRDVNDYAKSMYEKIGVEIVILDCVSFLRHFLHFFHRHRMKFLDAYQKRVLAEPESAVSQPVKELFLTLRQAAESE